MMKIFLIVNLILFGSCEELSESEGQTKDSNDYLKLLADSDELCPPGDQKIPKIFHQV